MGVDPNRNFDSSWGTDEGSSSEPCRETYRGPKAFSEIELVNLKNYLTRTLGGSSKVVYYMNIHSYSQLIMYAFGASNARARDFADLNGVANRVLLIMIGVEMY